MKKTIIALTIGATVMGVFSSCDDYLDKEVDLSMSQDKIFSNYDRTNGFLANIYTYLPDAFHGYTDGQYLAASRDCMGDNSISFWNVHRYHSIQSDSYDSKTHWFASQYWTSDLKGIRAANQFLANARESVIGNAAKSGDDNHLYNRWMAEARFLRAILHFDLACWFGAIPIEDHVLTNEEASAMTRTPAAEAFKWVADECDSIIASGALPFRYTDENTNWGRINGASVYALKSRALLYRASPLSNTSNSTSWWQEAADAALAFIQANNASSNPYKLYTTTPSDPDQNYYQCFVSTPHLNDEYILSRSEWTTYDIELYLAPCGFSGNVNSVGRTNPTENLVESYEMSNGLPIDDANSGYDPQNPYANRDPRLEQTILHHGSIWGDKNNDEERAVDVSYPDGQDYQELHGGTTTGYYTKKFLHNMSFKNPSATPHACPIFRYAEILMNAAEALNEAGKTDEAYQYVNQVRARVGMPEYSGMTQAQLRERIHNERRVEFAFEDQRYFDVRRWKLFDENVSATAETSKPLYQQVYNLYSMQVTPDGSQEYTIIANSLHPRLGIVLPKSYYFPVPDDEYKKDPNLGQNTGWELSTTTTDSTDVN
jgi:hypothetical protein